MCDRPKGFKPFISLRSLATIATSWSFALSPIVSPPAYGGSVSTVDPNLAMGDVAAAATEATGLVSVDQGPDGANGPLNPDDPALLSAVEADPDSTNHGSCIVMTDAGPNPPCLKLDVLTSVSANRGLDPAAAEDPVERGTIRASEIRFTAAPSAFVPENLITPSQPTGGATEPPPDSSRLESSAAGTAK